MSKNSRKRRSNKNLSSAKAAKAPPADLASILTHILTAERERVEPAVIEVDSLSASLLVDIHNHRIGHPTSIGMPIALKRLERELKSDPLLHTVLDHMSLISARIGGGGAIRIADGFYDWLCKRNPRAADVRWRVQDGKLRIDVDSITIRGARNVTDLAREMGWAVPERELVIATSGILSHFKQDLELKGLLAKLKDVPVEREDDEDGTESSISVRVLTVDGADNVVWAVRNTYPDFPGHAPEITVMFRDEY